MSEKYTYQFRLPFMAEFTPKIVLAGKNTPQNGRMQIPGIIEWDTEDFNKDDPLKVNMVIQKVLANIDPNDMMKSLNNLNTEIHTMFPDRNYKIIFGNFVINHEIEEDELEYIGSQYKEI